METASQCQQLVERDVGSKAGSRSQQRGGRTKDPLTLRSACRVVKACFVGWEAEGRTQGFAVGVRDTSRGRVHGIKWTCSNGNSSSGFSVEQLVQQILDSHQTKPQPRTHNCLCTGTLGAGSSVHHKCNSAKHRIISPKVEPRTGGYSAHSEVQNNDVSEGKNEHSHGKASSREKRNGKVAKPVLLHQNSTEVSSTNQVEVPDTTQNSPVSISSGLNSDPDMADSPAVTGVSSMAVASVMGSLSQSATVFMSEVTSEAVYTMSPTSGPNQHLLSSDAAAQGLVLAVSSDGHKFAFPTTGSSESLSMLPSTVSEELVLSTTLDGNRKIPETTMNFDPDCFLNNPKQGQTYGGGGMKSDSISTNIRQSPTTERSFNFNTTLTKEIKTEDTSFEQQMSKEAFSSTSASNTLTLTTGSGLLPSGGGLSPSTTLEQMDFSAIDSNKDYSSSFNQTVQSPHVHQTPSPSFFLQDASKPLPLEQNTHNNLNDSSSSFVNTLGIPSVKTESSSQTTSNCNGTVETRIESTSSLQLMQFQANFQAMTAEAEVPMETSQQAEGNENLLKSGDLQACSTEHYLQPEANGGIRNGNNLPILQGNMVQGLYPVAHPSLNNSSNMELNLDHFDISFSNQFSDLINDFISVEGGSNALYGHQLVSGDSAGLSQPEDGNRATYNQAEMCIPCCSPQQANMQLSSTENGASTMAYMHVAEVVSAAAAQGTLGLLQQSGRLFMVTDYSPEWSYPEVSLGLLLLQDHAVTGAGDELVFGGSKSSCAQQYGTRGENVCSLCGWKGTEVASMQDWTVGTDEEPPSGVSALCLVALSPDKSIVASEVAVQAQARWAAEGIPLLLSSLRGL
nr:PREDICTED: calmodulin-binding transcription activator 1-like [Phalacrocorax carbo]